MREPKKINYNIHDPIELNLSYMPFIADGGLFVPTEELFFLNEEVTVSLKLSTKKDTLEIDTKVVWITPPNALHHVLAGIGVQLIGPNAQTIRNTIESYLDTTNDVGGYTYGITEKFQK